jgi:cob(I)alamin adenosyltransferase
MVEKTRITKIYTKFGDGGNTVLVGGEITAKDSERVEAYGDIDELNSIIGLALVGLTSKKVRNILSKIQNDLFILGADLASKKMFQYLGLKKIE